MTGGKLKMLPTQQFPITDVRVALVVGGIQLLISFICSKNVPK